MRGDKKSITSQFMITAELLAEHLKRTEFGDKQLRCCKENLFRFALIKLAVSDTLDM